MNLKALIIVHSLRSHDTPQGRQVYLRSLYSNLKNAHSKCDKSQTLRLYSQPLLDSATLTSSACIIRQLSQDSFSPQPEKTHLNHVRAVIHEES